MGATNPFTYKGTKVVDGILSDWWSTTIKWTSDKDVLNVDYYFTSDSWKLKGYMDTGSVLPVRIEINGDHDLGGGKTKKIHHYYDYVNFETSDRLSAEAFSIPDGAVCNSFKGVQAKPVPPIPGVISYNRELIDAKGNVQFDRVVHDKKNGFVKIFSATDILYDFNNGVRYSIDNKGQCTRRAIDPVLDPDAKMNGKYVQDNGPSELSLLGNAFVYSGQKITRLLDSYSWSGNIDSKPFDVHFAKLNWKYPGYSSNSTPPPLSMINENIQYNFFDFKAERFYQTTYDRILRGCKDTKEVRSFKVSFFSKTSSIPPSVIYQTETINLFTAAVAKAAGVKFLQVVYPGSAKWDKSTNHLYFKIHLYGPTKPQYLYRRADNFAVQGTISQTVKVSESSVDKAVQKSSQLCEDNASSGKFLCRSFDLCKNSDGSYNMKMYLTLPKSASIAYSTSCNHFARSVDGKPDISLTKAVANLKQAVQKGQLKVVFDYTSSWGRALTAKLTAFGLDSNSYFRDRTSRMAYDKFRYGGSRVSIIKTEALTSVRSSQDCANQCFGRIEYECKAYSFCYGTKQCILSKSLPQRSKVRSTCVIRVRLYTSDFQYMRGKTIVTKDQVTLNNINGINTCAMKCLKYTKYKCESLDYCYSTKTCVLRNSHIYSLAPNQVQNITAKGCYHLSKNYILDFQVTKNTALVSNNGKKLRTISVSAPGECAYLCRTGYSGQGCVQFDYCSGSKQCHITSGASQNNVRHVGKAGCDTFTLAVDTNIINSQPQRGSTSYSNGSFAGLAIGMIIIGLAVGMLVIYVLHKKRIVHKIVAS